MKKKIFSIVVALVMFISFFSGMEASATSQGVYEVSTVEELKSALTSSESDFSININNDIDMRDRSNSYLIRNKNITINFNGNKIYGLGIANVDNSNLNLNGPGMIKGEDASQGYAIETIKVDESSTAIIENMEIEGGDGLIDNINGGYGISSSGNVYLDNCNVSSGNSSGDGDAKSALRSNGKYFIKNSTIKKGLGKESITYPTIDRSATILDFEGNALEIEDRNANPIIVGTGFGYVVSGNVATEANGTPAKINTEVTANAAIPAPTYTITIPPQVDFGSQKQALEKYRDKERDQHGNLVKVSKEFLISAEGVDNLFDDLGKLPQLNVTLSYGEKSLSGTTSSENKIPFILSQGENLDLASESVIAVFKNDVDLNKNEKNEANFSMTVNRSDIKNQDNYSGVLTFTVSIPDAIN